MLRVLQHPAMLILLCLALVGTPVSYRGGASESHAHTFLEFLLDASAGSFDHHHGAETAKHAHDAANGYHPGQGDGPGSELAESAPPVADRFAPAISAFVVGDVGQLAYILTRHELPVTEDAAHAVHPTPATMTGLTHPPTAPPPR